MRLTLIRDGDTGTPIADANISDHPAAGELSDALSEIGDEAQWVLIDKPAEDAKVKAAAEAAEAKAAAAGAKG